MRCCSLLSRKFFYKTRLSVSKSLSVESFNKSRVYMDSNSIRIIETHSFVMYYAERKYRFIHMNTWMKIYLPKHISLWNYFCCTGTSSVLVGLRIYVFFLNSREIPKYFRTLIKIWIVSEWTLIPSGCIIIKFSVLESSKLGRK